MSKIRRRASSVLLNWLPAMGEQEYRVIVRNEDTGERRIVHQGTAQSCRLPPDFRLSSDQLSFRVDARPLDDSLASFRRLHHYAAIPRLGDDYDAPAPDRLTVPLVEGAQAYRLSVQDAKTDKGLVDFARAEPTFLLPVGRLSQVSAQWRILHWTGSRWLGGDWSPVTPGMIAAGQARADFLVEAPEPPATAAADDAPYRPGRSAALATSRGPSMGSRLMIVVDVTARPEIASQPTPDRIVSEQWSNREGDGGIQRVASMIEANGLRGVFFVDVFAGVVLGEDAMATLARDLITRGHCVELLVNPAPWAPLLKWLRAGVTQPADIVLKAISDFERILGYSARAVKLTSDLGGVEVLRTCAINGLSAAIVEAIDQRQLPQWMRTPVNPFAAFDELVLFPVSTMLSIPAHARDRVVRHVIGADDALVAFTAERIAAANGKTPGENGLLTVKLDPMTLLERRRIRSASAAEVWNATLRRAFPAAVPVWGRKDDVFELAIGENEIMVNTMASLLGGLGRSGVASIDPKTVFSPTSLRAWTERDQGYEVILEQRRGSQGVRRSAIRRYDDAFRQALQRPPA